MSETVTVTELQGPASKAASTLDTPRQRLHRQMSLCRTFTHLTARGLSYLTTGKVVIDSAHQTAKVLEVILHWRKEFLSDKNLNAVFI